MRGARHSPTRLYTVTSHIPSPAKYRSPTPVCYPVLRSARRQPHAGPQCARRPPGSRGSTTPPGSGGGGADINEQSQTEIIQISTRLVEISMSSIEISTRCQSTAADTPSCSSARRAGGDSKYRPLQSAGCVDKVRRGWRSLEIRGDASRYTPAILGGSYSPPRSRIPRRSPVVEPVSEPACEALPRGLPPPMPPAIPPASLIRSAEPEKEPAHSREARRLLLQRRSTGR